MPNNANAIVIRVMAAGSSDWTPLLNDLQRSVVTLTDSYNAVSVHQVQPPSEDVNKAFSDALTPDGSSGGGVSLIVFGFRRSSQFRSLLNTSSTFSSSPSATRVVVLFNEVARMWSEVEACASDAACRPALSLVYMTSMFPPWSLTTKAQASPFVQMYHAALGNARNPLFVVGFLFGKFLQQIESFGGVDFVSKLYTVRVAAIGDIALGPFSDGSQGGCQDPLSCSCNIGPRLLHVFPIEALFSDGDNVTVTHSFSFSGCGVTYTTPADSSSTDRDVIISTTVSIFVILLALVGGYKFLHAYLAKSKVRYALKDTGSPIGAMIVAMKHESLLWERYPAAMPKAHKEYTRLVSRCVRQHRSYEVKQIGTSDVLIVGSSKDLKTCSAALAQELQQKDWGKLFTCGSFDREDNGEETTTVYAASSRVSESPSASRKSGDVNSHAQSSNQRRSHRRSSTINLNTIEFSIGLHVAHGRITYDEIRNAYDYSGPCVDTAAVLADRAQGHQLLMSDAFVESAAVGDEEAVLFGEVPLGGSSSPLKLFQYNPNTIERRHFVFTELDDDEAVDSVAATLQQQSAGLTHKKVTVLVMFIHNDKYYHSSTMEDIHKSLGPVAEEIIKAVYAARGTLLSLIAGRLIVVFNAKFAASQAPMRAYRLHAEICSIVAAGFPTATVSGGLDTKESIVGTKDIVLMGKDGKTTVVTHEVILSEVVEVATCLQRHCAECHMP
eukprot:PhM_4_TR10104/c0_g2_i1/m.65614